MDTTTIVMEQNTFLDYNTSVNTSGTEDGSGYEDDYEYPYEYYYPEDYVLYHVSTVIYPVHTFIFVIGGMLGNLLALTVMLQRNMRQVSSAVYIVTLAVSDNVALIGFLLGMVSMVYEPELISIGFCKTYWYILGTGTTISVWTVVAMTFERTLVVTFPFKAPEWTSRRKAGICVLVIIVVSILQNLQFFWTVYANEDELICDYLKSYDDFRAVWNVFDACVVSYIPLFIIFILNIMIMVQIKKAQKAKASLMNDQNGKNGSGQKIQMSSQITIMLLSVSIAFFICMTPYAVFQIYDSTIDIDDLTVAHHVNFMFANQMCMIFWEMNHSINVVLYSFTGKKFRNTMFGLFCCYCLRQPRNKGQTTVFSLKTADGTVSTVASSTTVSRK